MTAVRKRFRAGCLKFNGADGLDTKSRGRYSRQCAQEALDLQFGRFKIGRMARLDISKYADKLIRAAAPERAAELGSVWGQDENRVHLTDSPGFDIGAWFGLIQLTEATLLQIWLLGYIAWRAIVAYSGILDLLALCRFPFVRDEVAASHGQAEADADIDRLLARARAFRNTTDLDAEPWPDGVPEPSERNEFDNAQDKAAFDLLCIAGAYIFLHEIQHVRFEREGNKPPNPRDQEDACDEYAREYLLGKVEEYASSTGEPADKVMAKRALGIAVAKVLILEITPAEQWAGSESHSSVGKRVREFLASLRNPLPDYFWISVASFLAAICRSRGRLPERIPFDTPRELALKLADIL
jgi:Peptidase U49